MKGISLIKIHSGQTKKYAEPEKERNVIYYTLRKDVLKNKNMLILIFSK